jgi:hypothetical protein
MHKLLKRLQNKPEYENNKEHKSDHATPWNITYQNETQRLI